MQYPLIHRYDLAPPFCCVPVLVKGYSEATYAILGSGKAFLYQTLLTLRTIVDSARPVGRGQAFELGLKNGQALPRLWCRRRKEQPYRAEGSRVRQKDNTEVGSHRLPVPFASGNPSPAGDKR